MESPLHESIRLGHISTAQLLLRGGASVNLPGPEGWQEITLRNINISGKYKHFPIMCYNQYNNDTYFPYTSIANIYFPTTSYTSSI